jgi:hypothetical protein
MILAASIMMAAAQVPPPGGPPAPAAQVSQADDGLHTFKGYFNITDMGLLIGAPGNSNTAPFSFQTINGWHISEQFSTGLGVGVEFLSGSYMPITLDARYYVRNTNFSPFFFMNGGFALPLSDKSQSGYYWDVVRPDGPYEYEYDTYQARGGWLVNPGFGIRNMFSDNFGITFSVGYRFERLYYKSEKGRERITDYNRLGLRIGIIFR